MNLESVSAVIRPRSHWEAIDLGCRLARAHYPTLLLTTAAIVVPLFAVAHLAFIASPLWAGALLWWLKPLWERPNLFLLSRSLFGDTPTVREALRAFPRYGFLQWLPWLTIRRTSMVRSFEMPITQLERLRGPRRRKRADLLRRGASTTGALWLTVVCIHIEVFIFGSLVALAELMVPEGSDFNFVWWIFGLEDLDTTVQIVQNAIAVFAAILVAPFYVGCGFALYINRRTQLEGWDLEIAFKRMAARVENDARHRGHARVAALLACVGVGLSMLAPAPVARAEPRSIHALDRESAHESILEVLEGNDFHERDTSWVPKLDWEDEADEEQGSFFKWLYDWLFGDDEGDEPTQAPEWWIAFVAALLSWLAWGLEVLLIAAAFALIAAIVYRYRREWVRFAGTLRPGSRDRGPLPGVLMGMEVTPESLPVDVVATVLALWREGSLRAAYGLLYRATLAGLMDRYAVEFRDGFTERDCVRAARRAVNDQCARFFEELTHHWQLLAYRHAPPSDDVVQSLCAAWPSYFGPVRPATGASDGG